MFKPQMAFLITALLCSSLLAAPPVRKFDDPGAPPFKLLKEGEKPPLDVNFDNLIAQERIPPIIVIWIANGGGDAQGHERAKEYDNINGDYAEFIETEVLPRVEKKPQILKRGSHRDHAAG